MEMTCLRTSVGRNKNSIQRHGIGRLYTAIMGTYNMVVVQVSDIVTRRRRWKFIRIRPKRRQRRSQLHGRNSAPKLLSLLRARERAMVIVRKNTSSIRYRNGKQKKKK